MGSRAICERKVLEFRLSCQSGDDRRGIVDEPVVIDSEIRTRAGCKREEMPPQAAESAEQIKAIDPLQP